MLKYLKGADLTVKFNNKNFILPSPLVKDFDLLNLILRGYASKDLDSIKMKNLAVMELCDRLIDRARDTCTITAEQREELDAYLVSFYFSFSIELDLYLPALFPKTESEPIEGDTPLAPKIQSGSSQTV